MTDTYDPPRIEHRTAIEQMLIGVLINSANVDNATSAAFRSV